MGGQIDRIRHLGARPATHATGAMPSSNRCAPCLHIRTLPSLADLASGEITVQDFEEFDIEDLLGREPVPPSPGVPASNLTGKVVLVSGAGGSFSS